MCLPNISTNIQTFCSDLPTGSSFKDDLEGSVKNHLIFTRLLSVPFLICTSGDSHTTFTSNSLPKLHLYLFLYFHLYLYIYFHLYLYLYFHLYLYLIKIQYTVEWSAGLGFLSISSPMYWQLDSADHENQMKIIIRYYHIMIIRWWL